MPAPTEYKKAVHSLEKYNDTNRLAYRNGEPLFMILDCPEKGHADSNVVILKKIKNIEMNDVLSALMAMLINV